MPLAPVERVVNAFSFARSNHQSSSLPRERLRGAHLQCQMEFTIFCYAGIRRGSAKRADAQLGAVARGKEIPDLDEVSCRVLEVERPVATVVFDRTGGLHALTAQPLSDGG